MPTPVIIASHAEFRYGATPLPNFRASGAAAAIQWSSPYGSFNPTVTGNNQPTLYTPENQTDQVVITAQDLADNAASNATIQIFGTFPDRGQWGGVPAKLDDSTEGSFAADGSGDFSDSGPALRSFDYSFPGRTLIERGLIRTFLTWHRTVKKFFLQDPQRDAVFYKVKFTGEYDEQHQGPDDIDLTATFKEQPY